MPKQILATTFETEAITILPPLAINGDTVQSVEIIDKDGDLLRITCHLMAGKTDARQP